MWEYRATVYDWIDGDTLHVQVDLGFSIYTKQTVRLLASTGGVDTPELHGATLAAGMRSRARSIELAAPGKVVTIRTVKDKKDGFGRYLARVILDDGRDVGDILLAENLAVVWKG